MQCKEYLHQRVMEEQNLKGIQYDQLKNIQIVRICRSIGFGIQRTLPQRRLGTRYCHDRQHVCLNSIYERKDNVQIQQIPVLDTRGDLRICV